MQPSRSVGGFGTNLAGDGNAAANCPDHTWSGFAAAAAASTGAASAFSNGFSTFGTAAAGSQCAGPPIGGAWTTSPDTKTPSSRRGKGKPRARRAKNPSSSFTRQTPAHNHGFTSVGAEGVGAHPEVPVEPATPFTFGAAATVAPSAGAASEKSSSQSTSTSPFSPFSSSSQFSFGAPLPTATTATAFGSSTTPANCSYSGGGDGGGGFGTFSFPKTETPSSVPTTKAQPSARTARRAGKGQGKAKEKDAMKVRAPSSFAAYHDQNRGGAFSFGGGGSGVKPTVHAFSGNAAGPFPFEGFPPASDEAGSSAHAFSFGPATPATGFGSASAFRTGGVGPESAARASASGSGAFAAASAAGGFGTSTSTSAPSTSAPSTVHSTPFAFGGTAGGQNGMPFTVEHGFPGTPTAKTPPGTVFYTPQSERKAHSRYVVYVATRFFGFGFVLFLLLLLLLLLFGPLLCCIPVVNVECAKDFLPTEVLAHLH